MNRIKKLCILVLALCLLVPAFAVTASAATLSTVLYFEPQSPAVGGEVTVKVQFKAKNVGAVEATLSYNNDLLQFLPDKSVNATGGNGTVKLATVAGKSGLNSVTVEVVFRAVKTGSARIQVAVDEAYTFDKKSISTLEGARANMTIKAGSGNVTAITTQKPTTTKPTTTKPTTTGPAASTTAPVSGTTTADGSTQPDTVEPTTAQDAFAPEMEAVSNYTLFTPDDTVALPDASAFTKIVLTYGGEVFDAWYSPAMSQDILLVCAAKGDNRPAWYLLNLSTSEFTLYDVVSTKPPMTSATTTTATTTVTRPTDGRDVPADAAAQINVLRMVVVALAAVVVVLIIVIIVMGRSLANGKSARH